MRETKRVQKTPSAGSLPPLPDDISIKEYVKERYDGADDGDIFSKVQEFTLVERARELDLYPYFQPLDNNDGPIAQIYGKTVLMFGSNNYLGLTRHPYVIDKAREAVLEFGTSMTGSRFLNGSTKMHEELEGRIAAFLNVEAAVVFTTGYQANLGIISTLVDKKSVAVIDKAVHASVYDGCQMADGEMVRFRHNDADHLDQILSRTKKAPLVIVDGVYSMGGDIAPLPELSAVCKKHRARLLVDDAHGLGVLGEGGRGTASHFGLEDDVDLIMGTFSKALGSIGGFVAGPLPVLGWIKHFSRSMLFSASLPPASTAAALASLDVIEREPEIIGHLQTVGQRWREGLTEHGFDVGQAKTPIVPVNVGDEYRTIMFGKALLEAGVYTNTAVYPAVNMGEAILRTSCMATHTEEMVDEALEKFETVGRKLGVIT
ncbi:MAG: pyridoxal phosphate-dependent aminotransferase family protein [Chloroflexi bacterium]|nr:pyridoxal phosphate-dependent aminotransferase family protein [Chloroflexota bacterium]MCI0885691.1 pyridoxal phosphate-dependent aminotransferase family protein [Chloroflexota bacterium]